MFSLKKSIYKTRRDPGCECIGGEVIIGNQIWTCKNLDVTTYRNGDVIPQVTDPTTWVNLTTGAWCYYDNDPANGAIYGKLYNWYAVNDPRGLAPTGYHIPTYAEYLNTLIPYLTSTYVTDEGNVVKEVGTVHWNYDSGATNETCFTALPGGIRETIFGGNFFQIKEEGYWWTSTQNDGVSARGFSLHTNASYFSNPNNPKNFGQSVRLLKEDVPLEPFDYIIITYQYTPPEGRDYDLDTVTAFRYANSTLTGQYISAIQGYIPNTNPVGCGTGFGGADSSTPVGVPLTNAYMRYGGDDNNQTLAGTFGESVVINLKNLKDANITTSNDIVVELYAGWNSQRDNPGVPQYTQIPYPINIKYETFVGGTVSREIVGGTVTNRYVTTGTSVSGPQISPSKTITRAGCSSFLIGDPAYEKQHVASINYNLVTKVASVIFH